MTIKRWIGNAAAIADQWTITLTEIIPLQSFLMTINGKSVTYTAISGDTSSSILAALVTAWNSSTIPEFMELTSAGLPSGGTLTSVTLTADVAGKPSIVTITTSGSEYYSITNTVAASGPNDFANGQNWSGGVAPANGDTLVFDNGSVDCAYNLGTSLTGITLLVYPGYSGNIGLPLINIDASTQYAEYRPTSLTLAGGTAVINGPSIQRCNLAFGANTAAVQVLATGQRIDRYTPVVLITGGNGSSELDISKGDVGVANYQSDTANFPAVKISYISNPISDVTLYCGPGATLGTITKNGGTLTVNSNVTTLTQEVAGGTTTISAGAITTLLVEGGTAIYNSTGTLGTASIANKGLLDFNQNPRAKTVTNPIQVYGDNAAVQDDQKVVNSGTISFNINQSTKLNISHGSGNSGSLS